MDTSLLLANHEEAGTHLVVHCVGTNAEKVVVSVHETHMLAFIPAHFNKMLWTNTHGPPRCVSGDGCGIAPGTAITFKG